MTENNKPSTENISNSERADETENVRTDASNETKAETAEQKATEEAIKVLATEISKQTGVPVHTDEAESQKTLEEMEATDSNVKYHKETDRDTLERLEKEPKIKVYRAMQVIDGKLYPPMAASVGGNLVEANELGVWIRADENPELAIADIDPKTGVQKVDSKTGELKWKFKLDKGSKDATGKKATNVNAAYNPYWHMSRSPLNDQFKSAWIRPNIVVVECEVPESELTSGYKAERAKDAVGEVDWKSGSVSGEVFKQTGRARKVILSRWCKPIRVLDDAEVAERAKEFVGDAEVIIPENVLTPMQRIAFEEAGFKIGEPEKGVKKSEQIADALKLGLQIDNSLKETSLETVAPLSEENVDASVVSSDAVAKVQKKLDATKEIYIKSPNKTRGFITDVSKALDLKQHGASQYGTFETKDGKRFTIRISNHNTRATTFDENGEHEGISIVISHGRNRGIRDRENTKAHIVEFFYSKKDIETADGKPLVDIIESLRDTITTGEYEDKTGLAKRDEVNTDNVRFFRSKNGEVYGFVVDGEIHLDTAKMKADTPLHEYTHLWTEALRRLNPKEWENVKLLFDEVDGLKDEVRQLYPELKGDDLYEEMISLYSGREGTRKLTEDALRLAEQEGKSLTESVKAMSFIEKVKDAVRRYWKGVADLLGVHFTTADEVADKVLADWASERNPVEMQSREDPDYTKMTAEQGVEMSERMFGDQAEAFVDGQIKRATQQLEEAKGREIDMSQEQEDVWAAMQEKRDAIENATNTLMAFEEIKANMVAKKIAPKVEPIQAADKNIPLAEYNKPSTENVSNSERADETENVRTDASNETKAETAEQKATEEAIKVLATEITKQTGVPVHTDEAGSQKTLEEMEAKGGSLRFQIKTPEQRTAAENAYKWAQQHRPSEHELYALVDMNKPQMLPVYFSKADIASKERSYFNKLGWGNYKLINLDRTFEDNIKGLTGVFPEEFNPEALREHRGSRWAGGEVRGMDKLPDGVRMNPNELYNEISQYHGDYITRMLENVPEDGTGSFVSAHNGTWYVYSVSKGDRSINILDAIPATRENYDRFKEIVNDYGLDSETENIFSDMQKAGRPRRADSDMYERFLRGGAGRDNRLYPRQAEGERNNGNMGVDGEANGNTSSPRMFRSKNGEVYGFVVDGEIHLDTAKMKADTPLHEYTHLWTEALRRLNPKGWENVKLLFDEVDGLKDEVQKLCSIKILFVPLHKIYTLYI